MVVTNALTFDAEKLAKLIAGTFQNAEGPVSAKDFAVLYGVLAAQQEALLAVYALTMKAKPELIFTDQAIDAGNAITRSADMFGDALTALAAVHVPEDNGDE